VSSRSFPGRWSLPCRHPPTKVGATQRLRKAWRSAATTIVCWPLRRLSAGGPCNRDRGRPRGPTPPTPPCIRVRARRFVGSSGVRDQWWKAERGQRLVGQGDIQGRAGRDPPGAVRAGRGLRREPTWHAPLEQLIEPVPAVTPLHPGDRSQPPPDPLLKHAQDRRGLAVAEVAEPTDQVDPEILDHLLKADATCPSRQLPDPLLEPGQGLRRDPPPGWLLPGGEAEAQELAA
jgi:hypothetical protein